jgi:hypothetical protein
MKSKLTLLILLLAVFTSCKKTTNVDVTLSTSGKLTYKLLDDAQKGIPNVKVSLYDNLANFSNTTILLETRITDQNGIVDFGDLNPKNYLIILDSPMVNNVKYNIQDYVQILTGTTKNKEIKVSDFSGTFNLKVKSSKNNVSLKNVGVLIVPSNKYAYYSSTTDYFKIADYKGVCDDAGLVSFKVPSNKAYNILVYNVNTNVSYGIYTYQTVQTNDTVNIPWDLYEQY